jgi:electron transfer flavoprotein beta subunit
VTGPLTIVVLVKHVPDATAERRLLAADATTDRVGVDGLLSELDEYAVEEALKLVDAHEGQIVALTMGPDGATDAVRKALQMGADEGVHVNDEALHGSDAVATSLVLAKAITKIGEAKGGVDLVLTGMASTDGLMSVVPAMLAERLGLPHLGFAAEVSLASPPGGAGGAVVTVRRDGDVATETIEATLPALVAVTDQINEPRYPSFKGIMAAKKRPVQTWTLADLDVATDEVGLSAAWSVVEEFLIRPPRTAGTVVTDDGTGGTQLAEFLAARKFV